MRRASSEVSSPETDSGRTAIFQRLSAPRAAWRTAVSESRIRASTAGAWPVACRASRHSRAFSRTSESAESSRRATDGAASRAFRSMSACRQASSIPGEDNMISTICGITRGSPKAVRASTARSRTHQSVSSIAVRTSSSLAAGSLRRASTSTAKRRTTSEESETNSDRRGVRSRPASSSSASTTRSRTHQSSSRRKRTSFGHSSDLRSETERARSAAVRRRSTSPVRSR